MKSNIKIQLGLIIFMTVFALSLLVSQGASPDAVPFFALKRVQEKVFLKLKTSQSQKLNYGLKNK